MNPLLSPDVVPGHPWNALTEAERQELLRESLADLLAEPMPPPVRAAIERRGVEHERVRMLAALKAKWRADQAAMDAAAAAKTGGAS